jgi:hypothetical protein
VPRKIELSVLDTRPELPSYRFECDLPRPLDAKFLEKFFRRSKSATQDEPRSSDSRNGNVREMERALDMKSIALRFHSITNEDGAHQIVAEAIDNRTSNTVASYSLSMIAAWLKRHGYGWRFASSGIWDQQQRVA